MHRAILMEEIIKNFFESSTIHGLQYISTTRGLPRFLWIVVVLSGFTCAGILISESFKNWADNPVSTTLDTLPISKLKYPRITVCPPKDTFTHLNYYFTVESNTTFHRNIRKDLTEYAKELLKDHLYATILSDSRKLQDKDRYYNWYHGYAQISSLWSCLVADCHSSQGKKKYKVQSFAKQGSIFTEFYGEDFNSSKVETNIAYYVNVAPSYHLYKKTHNLTLHWKIESVRINKVGQETFKENGKITKFGTSWKNKTGEKKTEFRRSVSSKDLMTLSLDHMPGFNISWYFEGNPPKYGKGAEKRAFKRNHFH